MSTLPAASTAKLPGVPLTIFAMPKPFRGHIGDIQRNAITAWSRLTPRPEIILFGDEEGIAEAAAEFGARHVPDLSRNEYGTPLIDEVFRTAHRLATNDVLVFVNSDIILLDDLSAAVNRVEQSGRKHYLLVGRRSDVDVGPICFDDLLWERKLRQLVAQAGSLAPRVCKDHFVFRKPLFAQIPPFAVGRAAYDNWLLYQARKVGADVIDATDVVLAVHQNHDYGHVAGGRGHAYVKGLEAKNNIELSGGMRLIRGSTSDWIMTPDAIRRRRISSDLVQFAADLPRFLRLVLELYGFMKRNRREPKPLGQAAAQASA